MANRATEARKQAVQGELEAEINASRITTKMPSFKSVVSGDTAILSMPLGLTYDSLVIKRTGLSTDDIKNVKLKIGTTVIQEFKDFTEIETINKYYNRYEKSGYTTLYFVRREFNLLSQRDTYSIATYGIKSFSLECDIKEGVAVAIKLEAWAVQSPPKAQSAIIKFRRFPSIKLEVGENDVTSIPAKSRILAMHWKSANMDELRLLADKSNVYEVTKPVAQITQRQAKFARVPQVGYFHVDWALTGTPNSAIMVNGVGDLRFKPHMLDAEVVDVMVEYIDIVQGVI